MPLSEQLWCLTALLVTVADASSKVDSGKEVGRDLRYHAELDTKGKLQLHWDIDPPTETITFRLEARVEKDDVVGFGFSDYGEPFNADLVMMWADETGKHHFQVRLLHLDLPIVYIDTTNSLSCMTNISFFAMTETGKKKIDKGKHNTAKESAVDDYINAHINGLSKRLYVSE